ncbi:MAG: hypothetical protein SGPRY_011884, partial [Prymnesium sp.]
FVSFVLFRFAPPPMAARLGSLHSLPPADAGMREAAIACYQRVLPNIGRRFLTRYLARAQLTTLALLLPAPPEDESDSTTDESEEESEESEQGELPPVYKSSSSPSAGETQSPAVKLSSPTRPRADESYDVSAETEGEGDGANEREAEDPEGNSSQRGRKRANVEGRRMVGCISFEFGFRAGQALVQVPRASVPSRPPSSFCCPPIYSVRAGSCSSQVSLLAVKLKYQRQGVGRKLLRAVLEGEAMAERPQAAIAWVDRRAIQFYRGFGFSDDPILCSRYRLLSEPWERSTLMSVQLPPPLPQLAEGEAASRWAEVRAHGAARSPACPEIPLLRPPPHPQTCEEQIDSWRQSRLLEYSKELALIERLQASSPLRSSHHINPLAVSSMSLSDSFPPMHPHSLPPSLPPSLHLSMHLFVYPSLSRSPPSLP